MFHVDDGQINAYQMNGKYGKFRNQIRAILKIKKTFSLAFVLVIVQKKPPLEFME